MARLVQAEACEPDPHYRDDLRIARLIVHYAATGEAALCSPHVLASYMVLGLHPDKVWPAIEARRNALGVSEEFAGGKLPPKKPPRPAAVSLWLEKTNATRTINSRGGEALVLCDQTISVPMAAPSIAALFPNPAQPSSAKTRPFTLNEIKQIVGYSGAPGSICALTISALRARGEWPNQDGPATTVLSVAILGMMLEGVCCRRTVQRRIRRAVQLGFWRRLRDANSWTDCPKCRAKRTSGKCAAPGCNYEGRSKDASGKWTGEFMRVPVYEFDLQKFRSAQRCREIRNFEVRSYAELKSRPANVAAWPKQQPPKAAPERQSEPVRKTAEHQKVRTVATTQITAEAQKAAELVFEMCCLGDKSLIEKIGIGVVAEAKYQNVELPAAAKHIAECALRDQRNGTKLNVFYWRDLAWRTSNARGNPAAQKQQQLLENYREAIRRVEMDYPAADDSRGREGPDGEP